MRTPLTVARSTSEELFGSERVPVNAYGGASTCRCTAPTVNRLPTAGTRIGSPR